VAETKINAVMPMVWIVDGELSEKWRSMLNNWENGMAEMT
jgi:hypothetical protein